MSAVILELNDSGLLAQAGGDVLLDSPGFVTARRKSLEVGPESLARVKQAPTKTEYEFWDKLGMDTLAKPNPRARSQADLAFIHLDAVWKELQGVCQDLILVVPGDWHRDQLGLMLGMARKLDMPVRALVDAAVACSATPQPGRLLYHLDLHLHRCILTRLDQSAWLEREDVLATREFGLARVREAWTHAVAGLFVQATRFDPMHQAETEQWLFDRLHRWVRELAEHEHVDIDLSHGGRTHTVRLHRRQMVKAIEPLVRRLRRFLADNIPGDQPVALQLSHRLAELPGLIQALESLPDVELVVLDELAARNGVGRLYLGHGEDGAQSPYVTRVPWFNARDLDAHGQALTGYERRPPTHVLHQALAYPLTNGQFSVGTRLGESATGIRLDERFPGVVGEHFRLSRDGGRVLLEDLSGGHTVVNDDPVAEPTPVAVGDRIRIGNPGTEFLLISVEDGHGA